MKRFLCSVLACFLICPAFAQNEFADTTTGFTISDSTLDGNLISSSFSTIKSVDHRFSGNADLAALIDGNIPGVQVTDNGTPGTTGNLMIRGVHSTNGDDAPLIVLDGFPYYADLNTVNSADIESISVLKSADAWVKYGFRGANGVIEINTKKGKFRKEPLKITIDAKVGINTRAFPAYSVLKDEKDYYETTWDMFRNYYYGQSGGDLNLAGKSASDVLIQYLGGYNSYNVPDKQVIDPATGKLNPNAQLKYHGDDWQKEFQRTALRHEYNVSALKNGDKGSVLFSAGYLKDQGYIKATDFERFSARMNGQLKVTKWMKAGLNASFSHTDKHVPDLTNYYDNPILISQLMPPIYPYYYRNAAGEKEIDPETGKYKYDSGNINGDRLFANGVDALAYLNMQHKENKNKFTTWNISPYLELTFLKDFSFTSKLNMSRNISNRQNSYPMVNSWAYFNDLQKEHSFNQKLTWNKQIKYHNLKAAFSYEMWNDNLSNHTWTIDEIENRVTENSFYNSRLKQKSLIGEINYNYNTQYFISGGVRKEWNNMVPGSIVAWTAGGAWDLAQTKLLKNHSGITQLKIWSNYGTSSWNYEKSTPYWHPEILDFSTQALDLGLDFELFRNRFKGTFQVFNRQNHTTSMIPGASSTGIFNYFFDTDFKSQGAELALSFTPILSSKFYWDFGLNLSHYKTEVLNLNGMPNGYMNGRFIVGEPLYSLYAYESMGVDPANGNELFAAVINGQKRTTSDPSEATQSIQGSITPDLFGGFSNRLKYKNFDLSFQLTFALGGKYYDHVYQDLMGNNLGENWSPDILNRWTIEQPNSTIPKLEINGIDPVSRNSRFITNASWLKVSDVTLAYTFKKKKIEQMKLDQLSVYVTAHNLWMWSARKGMDPQISFYNDDPYAYAAMRTIMFGLRLGL